MSTRDKFRCRISGKDFSPLNDLKLPTYEDIYLAYLWESSKDSKFRPSYDKTMSKLLEDVQCIWKKASIPTVSMLRCKQKIKIHHEKYIKMISSYTRDKEKPLFQEKMLAFNDQGKKLFNIEACKCYPDKKNVLVINL